MRAVVVGGGIMGASIAMHLARRLDPIESRVLLLERRKLGAGSSGRSGAVLRCHYADPEVAALARDGLREYAGFAARTGRDIGFRRCGVLTLAGPDQPEWRERVRRNTAMMRSIGIDARAVDAAEMRALVPGIAVGDGAVGCWEPDGGFVEPLRAVAEFAAVARTLGAITRLGVEARAIRVEDGRALGVESSEGWMSADAVIVVGGPWSRALLATAGVDLPLTAVRPEQHFHVPAHGPAAQSLGPLVPRPVPMGTPRALMEPTGAVGTGGTGGGERTTGPVAHPVVIDLELGFYTRCDPEHARTRVGRIDYTHDRVLDDPDQLDERVSEEFRDWARGALCRRLPAYASVPALEAQAAWYTLTPDAQPVLGAVPGVAGLYVATGFSGHGFKLAPAVGLGLAQIVLGEPVSAFDVGFFSPARFASGRGPQGGPFGL